MQLNKLLTQREAQHRIIATNLEKIQAEDLSTSNRRKLLEILTEKVETIKTLTEKVANHADVDDFVTELVESEQYLIDLELKIDTIREGSSNQQRDENQNSRENRTPDGTPPSSHVSLDTCNSSNASYHKLPKLTLPQFNGNVTEWQTFWDCFESSIHFNTTLSDVQKFSYLRSLLFSEAATCIAGFQLTHANYGKAVDLLKERFGQPHKIISAYMQSLLELPRPDNSTLSLQSFHDNLETFIRGLESLGQCQDSYGDLLVPIIREKLPSELKRSMARDHGNKQWTLPELRDAIRKEVNILQEGETIESTDAHFPTASFFTGSRSAPQKQLKKSRPKVDQTKSVSQKKTTCAFCGQQHAPADCMNIVNLAERLKCVKSKRLCFNCLGEGHQIIGCKSRFRCRHCQRKHHTAICQQKPRSLLNPEATPFQHCAENLQNAAVLHSTTQTRPNVLLKTAVANVSSSESTAEAHILFDEGAQRSFISQKLADELQLKPTGTDTVHVASFGQNSQSVRYLQTAKVHLITDRSEKIAIDVLIVPTIAVPLCNIQQEVSTLKYLHGLKLAHPVTTENSFEISLLIGADSYWKIVQNRVVRGNGPTAVQSRIGYLLSGPLPVHKEKRSITQHMLNVITSPPNPMDLERFWKLESIGITLEEDIAKSDDLTTYMDTCISFSEGKYVAKLPWKEDHPPLPTNYAITLKRTENMICRLRKEPHLFKKYGEIINEQQKRGFIEEVCDPIVHDHPVHYIPHHGVKKDSATTPIRIVYDCSCRQSADKPSLNDCLRSTPPELNDLTGILIRFRMNKFAITTDIEKAFLHVSLDEKDRDVTRFLWPKDPSNPLSSLTTYRFKAVLFGATCSPFILCATIIKHLENNRDNWVSKHLIRDIYVDNIISSFSCEQDVIEFYRDTRAMMSAASFNLRSWNSNSKSVREAAKTDQVLDKDEFSKVLGMKWDANNDLMSQGAEKSQPPEVGIEPGPQDLQANTLPRHCKSRLLPQGSRSVVLYTYPSYIFPCFKLIRPRIYSEPRCNSGTYPAE